MTYDEWKLATPPEYEHEDEPECSCRPGAMSECANEHNYCECWCHSPGDAEHDYEDGLADAAEPR